MYYVTMVDGKSYYVDSIERFTIFGDSNWIIEQNGRYLNLSQILTIKYLK